LYGRDLGCDTNFHHKENIEAYLDWEMKVDQLFDCHVFEDEQRVSLATLRFQGNALCWWTSLVQERRRKRLPSYYHIELMDKLQRLQQRSMTIEEYRKKMELYTMMTII